MKNDLNFSEPKYSNSNKLTKDFRQSYLNSLQIILDDNKFKEKTETLPLLKSSVINKYEKMLAKAKFKIQSQKKNKINNTMNNLEQNNNDINKNEKPKNINPEKNTKKIVQIRYIILDKQLTEITLKTIEENSEINNKLSDPFNSFFQESNQKIRKNALEQLINNIFIVENESEEKDKLPEINNKKTNLELDLNDNNKNKDIFYKDLEALEDKFSLNTEEEKRNHEKYGKAISIFEAKCLNYNLITLGQKIDFFTYLYNEEEKKKQKLLFSNKANKKKTSRFASIYNSPKKSDKRNNYYNSILKKTAPYYKRKSSLLNINLKSLDGKLLYYYDIRTFFKISEENINNNLKYFEKFEREFNYKMKNFQLVQNKLETSSKLIDKLKLYFLTCEITSEKIILRDCNISSDSLLYLLSKKYFDFSPLLYVNISKNNLGDLGGTYLLYLITKYSKKIEVIFRLI